MDSNITNKTENEDYILSDEEIAMFRDMIKRCPNPYTEEEFLAIPYDGYCDSDRLDGYTARLALAWAGIPFEEE